MESYSIDALDDIIASADAARIQNLILSRAKEMRDALKQAQKQLSKAITDREIDQLSHAITFATEVEFHGDELSNAIDIQKQLTDDISKRQLKDACKTNNIKALNDTIQRAESVEFEGKELCDAIDLRDRLVRQTIDALEHTRTTYTQLYELSEAICQAEHIGFEGAELTEIRRLAESHGVMSR